MLMLLVNLQQRPNSAAQGSAAASAALAGALAGQTRSREAAEWQALGRSADFQSAVSPNCTRQSAGSVPRVGVSQRLAECNSAIQQSATPRYDGALNDSGWLSNVDARARHHKGSNLRRVGSWTFNVQRSTFEVQGLPQKNAKNAEGVGFFPLTLTLSRGAREQRALPGGKPTAVDCSPARAGFTLSPRERAGVRGNGAKHLQCIEPIPELAKSA